MQRPKSNTRQANALERYWHDWLAVQPCVFTDAYPVELDHVVGSTGRNNGVLIGHWFVIPVHPKIHEKLTLHRWVHPVSGIPIGREFYSDLMMGLAFEFCEQTHEQMPEDVTQAIADWGIGRTSKILPRVV